MMKLQLPDGNAHDVCHDDDVQRIIVQYLWKQDCSTLKSMPLPVLPNNGKPVFGRNKSDLMDKKVEKVEGTDLWIGLTKRLGWAINRMNTLLEACGQKPEEYWISLGQLGSGKPLGACSHYVGHRRLALQG